jgi:hypothetical protein
MGVELPSDADFVRRELSRIRKYYGKKWGNISFQFGFINEIISFENCGMRENEFVHNIRQMRLNIR